MPLYIYRCEGCTEESEMMLKFSELDDPQLCPKCGEEMYRVVGNGGGFRLNGKGWARDGYSSYVGNDKRWSESSGYNGKRYDEI